MKFGVLLWNWYPISDALNYVKKAKEVYNFEQFWFCDNLQYWNVFVTLTAIGSKYKVPLGTQVTHPYARNPIDIAAAFSSISHVIDGKEVAIGFGRGGGVLGTIINQRKPLTTLRESTRMIRMLLDGKNVQFNDFPFMSELFNLRKDAGIGLAALPKTYVPIFIGASGLKACEIAGEEADGIIIGSLSTIGSITGIEKDLGFIENGLLVFDEARKKGRVTRPPTKIFNTWIAVSNNEEEALKAGRHHASYGIAQSPDSDLPPLGISLEVANKIRERYRLGYGPDEAAKVVPANLVNCFAVAGTPKKCVDTIEKILPKVEKLGFEQFTFGISLGTNVMKALDYLGKEILPCFEK